MKILMLTPYLPFPRSSGGQIRSYNLIKHLSKKHEISLFSLIKDDGEKEYIKELKRFCPKVRVFKRSKTPFTFRNILRTGFGTYPFLVIRNLVVEEKYAIEKELANEKYDLIHAETFYVMPHIPETSTPVLLVDQTIEYLVYKHYVDEQAPFFARPLFSVDVAKLKHWEKTYWRKASKVVAVSEADKKEMLSLVPNLEVGIVPNGVDLEFFKAKENWDTKEPKILFVGNFKWMQNTEAAMLLLEEIFPKIKREYPRANLWIVGQHIPESLKTKSSADIKVRDLPYDDEDSIRKAYHEATIFVSPLKGPGGTRLKHFAAMASKLPIVTTTVGAEGLGATNGEHLMVCDRMEDVAAETIRLIKNSKLAEKIANNARKLVVEKYSWERMADLLDKIYKETSCAE
jgi:glycosyltransferase involved in cell wall biosynthesis